MLFLQIHANGVILKNINNQCISLSAIVKIQILVLKPVEKVCLRLKLKE